MALSPRRAHGTPLSQGMSTHKPPRDRAARNDHDSHRGAIFSSYNNTPGSIPAVPTSLEEAEAMSVNYSLMRRSQSKETVRRQSDGALNSTAEPESVDGGSESRGGSGGYDGSDSGAYSVSEDGAGYDGLDEWRSGSADCSVSGSRQSEDDVEPAARSGFLDDLVDDLVKEAETPLHTHTSPRGEPSRSSRQQSHREPRDEEDDEGRRTRSRRRTKARKQRSVHATMGIEPGAPYSQRLPRRHDKQDGSRPSTAPAGRRRGRRNGSSRGDGRSNRGKGRDSTGPIYFVDPDTVAAEPNSLYSESFLERDDHMRDSLLYDAIVGDSGDDDDDGSDPDFLRPNLRWGAGESGRRSSAHRGGAAIWAEEDARMVTTLRKRLTAASMVLEDQQDAIEALAAEKDRADEELSANAAEVAMFERQIAVLEKARGADLELYEMEVGQIRAEAAAQVKRARKRARKARTEMRKTKKELKRKDEVLQAKVKRYEEEIRVLADRSGDTAGLKAQVKQLRAAVASRDSRIRDLEYQAQVGVELTKDQADREREFAAQKKVDAARNEVSRVKNAKAALEAEVVRLTADCDRLRGEVGDTGRLMAKIERLRGDLERQTAHAKALNLKLNKVTHENINLNMDMETLREQVERLQRGLPPPRPAPPRVASVPTAASTAHRHSPGPEPGGSASDTAGASKKTRARAAGKKSGGRSARRARVAAPARSSGGGGGGGGVPLPGKMGARKSRSRGPSRASKGAGSGAGRSTKRGRRSKQGSGP